MNSYNPSSGNSSSAAQIDSDFSFGRVLGEPGVDGQLLEEEDELFQDDLQPPALMSKKSKSGSP